MSSVLDEVVDIFEPSPELVSVMAEVSSALLLGLDIGTSGVRATLFDERCREITGASVHTARNLTTDFAEMDAASLFELVVQTIDDLFATPFATGTHIKLISVSCFWHSLMGVDSDNRATTPVFGWADTRSANAVYELRATLDEKELHRRTGCRFHSSYWPAKLLWLRAEQASVFDNTRRWMGFGEYVVLRLFGDTAASVSMASATGLFNQANCDWDHELIRTLKLSAEKLPALATPDRVFIGLEDEYAQRWPELIDARLYPPIGDGAANNIGAGCHNRDTVALMIGTSSALRVLYEGNPPDQIPSELWSYRADHNRVVVGGALSDGGGLYRWLTGSLILAEDHELLQDALGEMAADAHGLTILPFWSGERSTGWSPDAHGGIFGLTTKTKPIEVLRAAMEAIAYRLALIAIALKPISPDPRFVAAGNALRSSATWVQIICDVLGKPVTLTETAEASTRGAALLALEAAGKIQSIEESIPVGVTFEPDMTRHARYQQGLERQQDLYERLMTDR